MKHIFTTLTLLAHLLCFEKSWVIEFAFKGTIPEVFNDSFTVENNQDLITLNQWALPQRDNIPFPIIAQGLALNVLATSKKFELGFGYEFHYDFHTIFYTNSQSVNKNFTAKLQNNLLYGVARLNLKHDQKNSIFIGLKLGLMFALQGYSDDLGLLNSLAVGEGEKFNAFDLISFSPGLYAAFQFGFKLYFLRGSKIKLFPGIKIIAELGAATPTFTTGKQRLDANKTSVTSIDNELQYRWNYSNFGIRFVFFAEFARNKLFSFEKPPKTEYKQN